MPSTPLTIDSERVDELPILLEFAKQLGVAEAIDQSVGPAHGNRQGLSYGQLAWGLMSAIAMRRDHRLNHIEAWAVAHRPTLEQALGQTVGEKDFTDDRLAALLWELGDAGGQVHEAIEAQVGQRIVRAYALPTEVGRADTTTVSVYHGEETADGLVTFGHSKDHRPDLRQFVEVLGTLDPAGVPLVTSTLAGNHADDRVYWPTWQRMTQIIGQPDWLFVGDSKLHSAENVARIHRAGGWFLAPIPLKGHVPDELAQWLAQMPRRPQPVRLPDAKGELRIVGHGFVVDRYVRWTDPATKEVVVVPERVFLVRRTSFKRQQLQDLQRRLEQAEAALDAKDGQRTADPRAFEATLQALVERYRVAELLQVAVRWTVERQEKCVGRGRPGPERPKQVVERYRAQVTTRRQTEAIAAFTRQAGWRPYGTNASRTRLSLQQAVDKYAGQWQPEQGFHRFKGEVLKVAPIFLRTERHIRGLLLIAGLVLRVLTLVQFVARRTLSTEEATLRGLYAGAPHKATARPTAERLLAAFEGLTLYTVRLGHRLLRQLSPLTALHHQILHALNLPVSLYTHLETG
jgi:transposase